MTERGTVYPGMGGAAEIEPGVFVAGPNAIKTITLPPEYGSKVVRCLGILRVPNGAYYFLDNDEPNVVIDNGRQMLWANIDPEWLKRLSEEEE